MAVDRTRDRRSRCFSCVVITIACWTFARPDVALAECLRLQPAREPGVWCTVDGTHVRVWWEQSTGLPDEEQKATRIRDEVEGRLWPLFESVLQRTPLTDGDLRVYASSNGGDGRYDIMLTAMDSAGSSSGPMSRRYGQSPPVARVAASGPTARFSLVRRTLPEPQLLAKAAHELMHGFLTSFRGAGARDLQWLEEATATWAEHLAFPNINTEHEYAVDLFQDPSRSLMASPGTLDRPRYGAYLFLFFLQHRGNAAGAGNRDLVRRIWETLDGQTASDPIAAFNAVIPGGLAAAWREFMTDNWNDEPATALDSRGNVAPVYVAWDNLRDGISRRKVASGTGRRGAALVYDVNAVAGTAPSIPLTVRLPPLSAAYFVFRFDVSVRSVELRHNLRTLQAAGAEVVVFTRQGTNWTSQPRWGNEDVHSFCRDRGGERIDEMLLMLGNAAATTTLTFTAGAVTPYIKATRSGCINPTTERDAGFQECEFRFPSTTNNLGRTYQHLHRETWELVGAGTVDTLAATARYQYRWTMLDDGGGSASNPSARWNATWAIASVQQTGALNLRDESGQGEQSANRETSNISTLVTVTQVDGSGTQTATPALDEYRWLKRSAPRSATRIEGFDVIRVMAGAPAIYQWPGLGQLADAQASITCRWSFPAAPTRP